MTLAIFLGSLVLLMVLGMPMAFALVLTGVALMFHLDFFDTQLLAQNLVAGVDNFPLLAVPFFILAGELMNAGGISAPHHHHGVRPGSGTSAAASAIVAIAAAVLMASMSGSAIADTAALATHPAADDARPRLPGAALGRPDRVRRHHRAHHPAVDALHHLRRHHQYLDLHAVPGRHRAGPADGRGAGHRLDHPGAAR